jgi:hypothetical protein
MHLMKRPFSKKRPNVICCGERARIKVQVNQSTAGFLIAFVEPGESIKQCATNEKTIRFRSWL